MLDPFRCVGHATRHRASSTPSTRSWHRSSVEIGKKIRYHLDVLTTTTAPPTTQRHRHNTAPPQHHNAAPLDHATPSPDHWYDPSTPPTNGFDALHASTSYRTHRHPTVANAFPSQPEHVRANAAAHTRTHTRTHTHTRTQMHLPRVCSQQGQEQHVSIHPQVIRGVPSCGPKQE